jgi:hypothetical protein
MLSLIEKNVGVEYTINNGENIEPANPNIMAMRVASNLIPSFGIIRVLGAFSLKDFTA